MSCQNKDDASSKMSSSKMSFKFHSELEFAKEIAVQCGELALTYYSRCGGAAAKSGTKISSKAHAADLVTEGDQAVEQFFTETVKSKFENKHKILGEENSSAATETSSVPDGPKDLKELKDSVWVVDPIDGTMNFVHGFPHWCVSIGFIAEGEIQLGVIYQPCTGELYYAGKGIGSFKNGNPIKVSGAKEFQGSLGTINPSLSRNPLIRKMVESGCHGVRCTAACALQMCELAQGSVDWYCHEGVHAWDYCAGTIIVQEAGGVVVDMNLEDEVDIFNRRFFALGSKSIGKDISQQIDIREYIVGMTRDKLVYS